MSGGSASHSPKGKTKGIYKVNSGIAKVTGSATSPTEHTQLDLNPPTPDTKVTEDNEDTQGHRLIKQGYLDVMLKQEYLLPWFTRCTFGSEPPKVFKPRWVQVYSDGILVHVNRTRFEVLEATAEAEETISFPTNPLQAGGTRRSR